MRHALERENHAVALGIGLALDTDFAVDHGHNAVTKFLVNESLDWGAIYENPLHIQPINVCDISTASKTIHLEETVQEGILRRNRAETTTWEPVVADLSSQVRRRNFQQIAKLRQLFVGGFGLPQRMDQIESREWALVSVPARKTAQQPKPRRVRRLCQWHRKSILKIRSVNQAQQRV